MCAGRGDSSRLDNGTGFGRTGSGGGGGLTWRFVFFQTNLGPTSRQCPQRLRMVSEGSIGDRLSLAICAWRGGGTLGGQGAILGVCASDMLAVSGAGGGWMQEPVSFLGSPQWRTAKGTWGPESLGLAPSWPQSWD